MTAHKRAEQHYNAENREEYSGKQIEKSVGYAVFHSRSEIYEFNKSVEENIKREDKREQRERYSRNKNSDRAYQDIADTAENGELLFPCVSSYQAVYAVSGNEYASDTGGRLSHQLTVYKHDYANGNKSRSVQKQPYYIDVLFNGRLYAHTVFFSFIKTKLAFFIGI